MIAWTLVISAWGVVGPLVAWSMGKQAGADAFRKAYFRHPSVRALDEVRRTTN